MQSLCVANGGAGVNHNTQRPAFWTFIADL